MSKNISIHKAIHRLRSNIGERSLVLVGLMGAGKTTIGKRLAQLLNLDFYDADHEIEHASQMSISEIFAQYGEQEFRDLEKRVILRLLNKGPIVLATGGGAYINEQTREAIHDQALAIWLDADLDTLMDRVSRRSHRPLLQNDNPRAVMERLITERYPIYAKAHLSVMSTRGKRDAVTRQVIKNVDAFLAKENESNSAIEAQ